MQAKAMRNYHLHHPFDDSHAALPWLTDPPETVRKLADLARNRAKATMQTPGEPPLRDPGQQAKHPFFQPHAPPAPPPPVPLKRARRKRGAPASSPQQATKDSRAPTSCNRPAWATRTRLRALARWRLWRVAMVIARVAEIEICSESVDFDDCLVGFFIIKYRLQCLMVVAVTSHSLVHHLPCCLCFQFPSPCKYGYNKAAVEVQCCMRRQLACRAQRQGHDGPCSAPAVNRTQNQVRVERWARVQG